MSAHFKTPAIGGASLVEDHQLDARIAVIGVGGAGSNIIDSLIDRGISDAVQTIAINTDVQALNRSRAGRRYKLGADMTCGRGTGSDPDKGRELALFHRDQIGELLGGFDLVFVVAGMGGGTGSGAAPIIAGTLRETGALVVSVGTAPFGFEGKRRGRVARQAHEALLDCSDAVVVLRNDQLLRVANQQTRFRDAMRLVDNHVSEILQGVVGILARPGSVNVDFADLRAILEDQGEAMFAVGHGAGDHRIHDALVQVLNVPLLQDRYLDAAQAVMVFIECREEPGLKELSDMVEQIQAEAHPDVNLIWGWCVHDDLPQDVRLTLLATGFPASGGHATSGWGDRDGSWRVQDRASHSKGHGGHGSPDLFRPLD